MQTKFAIGCLVQWYEIEILSEYISSLSKAIDNYDSDKVLVDIRLVTNQELEQVDEPDRLTTIINNFNSEIDKARNFRISV